MKLRYLGTAAAEGWPALFCSCPICTHAREAGGRNLRTRTQAVLDDEILLDFPPDTYCHALRHGMNLAQIHTLLVTHSHMDHWFPTDLIHRHEHFGHGAEGVLDVYGNEAVEREFDSHILIDRFKPHPLDEAVHFHRIHGGIAEAGIEKALGLKVEKLAYFRCGSIGKGRALDNGQNARFAIARRVPGIKAEGRFFHAKNLAEHAEISSGILRQAGPHGNRGACSLFHTPPKKHAPIDLPFPTG